MCAYRGIGREDIKERKVTQILNHEEKQTYQAGEVKYDECPARLAAPLCTIHHLKHLQIKISFQGISKLYEHVINRDKGEHVHAHMRFSVCETIGERMCAFRIKSFTPGPRN